MLEALGVEWVTVNDRRQAQDTVNYVLYIGICILLLSVENGRGNSEEI